MLFFCFTSKISEAFSECRIINRYWFIRIMSTVSTFTYLGNCFASWVTFSKIFKYDFGVYFEYYSVMPWKKLYFILVFLSNYFI